MADGPPIEVRELVKVYGDVVAVDRVSLTVQPGDVFGYLGPNGAGKTTSLRMMLGLIRPTSGDVRLFGRDPLLGVAALEGSPASWSPISKFVGAGQLNCWPGWTAATPPA